MSVPISAAVSDTGATKGSGRPEAAAALLKT